VQIIDFSAPWEVFGVAGYKVFTVGKTNKPPETVYGMKLRPADYNFKNAPKADIVLVPGGEVFTTQKDSVVLKWLVAQSKKDSTIILSVCNGAFILAKAGILNGLSATTTRQLVDGLAVAAPNITVVYDKRFVDNGKIITSGGLSCGIDAALHLVSRFNGLEATKKLAAALEYNWQAE
jgi:transcriptional regulator GlxA family with amidase domain